MHRISSLRSGVLLVALASLLHAPAASAQVCGDCDQSGTLNILDALLAARHGAALTVITPPAFNDCDVDSTGTINVLDALLIAQAAAGLSVPLACMPPATFTITQVEFDWSTTVPDGYALRRNASSDIVVPEWLPSASRNNSAFFIGGTTPTIRFRMSVTPTSVTSARVRISTGGSSIGDFTETLVNFTSGASGDVQITLAAPVPTELNRQDLIFDWFARDIGGSGSPSQQVGTTGPHRIYTNVSTPTSPWTTAGTTEPWTDVLDYLVGLAAGETTVNGSLNAILPPFRDNTGMQYDTYWGAPGYSIGTSWTFNLSLMMTRIPTATLGIFCCYDPARALAIFGNLVGGSFRFWFLDSPSGFFVNCIDLNGRGWTNSPFYSNDSSPMIRPPDMGPPRWAFGNHGYTAPSAPSPPAFIWDGTFAGDGDGNPDEPPHVRTDMIELPMATYTAIAVDDNPYRSTYAPYIITFSFQ